MAPQTPVLLLLYNRPDKSKIVLDAIRKARPRQLFVAADGPSEKCAQDQKKCAQTRDLVNMVDWNCDVRTLFREENLGCRRAISSAISWFYDQVEEGIILEDDCLPSQSFFSFCTELLERYRHNDDVMVISGDNFQGGRSVTDDSYYFSRYPHCWGWATWRRAWRKYDATLADWPVFKNSQDFIDLGAGNTLFKSYWSRNFEQVLSGGVDSWAYAWTLNCWANGGLTVIPEKNLVKNIGFGSDATHTTESNERISMMQAEEIGFPLCHPSQVKRHLDADLYSDIHHFGIKAQGDSRFLHRLMQKLRKICGLRSKSS